MSYNIDTCKIKKMENFVIPLKELYVSDRKDWHPKQPKIIDTVTMEVSISCGCGQEIKGILKDGLITVTKLDLAGEGSGTLRHFVLDHAFSKSTGELEATLIWEGGNSVTSLKVKDGVLTETPVEL